MTMFAQPPVQCPARTELKGNEGPAVVFADPFRVASVGLIQNDGHIRHLIALMDLRHHRPLIRGLDDFQHFHRTIAELRHALGDELS